MAMTHGVGVIIAAHNAQATIGRAVASALAQEHVAEVIVVDDASLDGTGEAARLADDNTGRLRVVALADNGGPARARNIALEHSQTPYVCVLDSDDYFLPGRIASLLAVDTGQWDILADDIVVVPEQAQHLTISLVSVEERASNIDLATFVMGNISHSSRPRAELGFLKPLLKREFLDRHALRYDEALWLGEDYALYVQALIAGARFGLVGARGYVAIQRHASISGRHSARDLERLAEFDGRCLTSAANLSESERAALCAHRAATLRKHRYRAVLDCKQARGLLPALGLLASDPRSVPFIVSETVKAKTAACLAALSPSATPPGGGIRLLLGLPQSRLAVAAPELGKDRVACASMTPKHS